MNITIEDNIPTLLINNYKIEGWNMGDMPQNYYNQEAIVFCNDQMVDKLEDKLYELIKGFTKEDFHDPRIEFVIDQIHIDINPEPLEKVPYPFYGITIGIKNDLLRIRFNTLQEKGSVDDDWDKKWTTEFYFDSFSKVIENESNLTVQYKSDDDFLSISVEVLSSKKNIEDAVEDGIERLEELLQRVENTINGLDGFFNVIEIWQKNKYTKSEKFWQNTFKKYSWILSMAINEPSIIIEDEAFVGGKNVSNENGNIIDFIYKNKISENVALIEIKTPVAKILGSKYRNTFSISSECSGAINQLLNYKDAMQKEFFALAHKSQKKFDLLSPNCYLIIGSHENMRKEQKECFENFRRNILGVEILTFDEIFEKLFFVLSLLRHKLND